MIVVLFLLYALAVWLIFFKFRWLPFSLPYKILVCVIGVSGITSFYLTAIYCHPSTSQVRVIRNVIPISAWVTKPSRVIEVPIQPNVPLKKGEVLFKLDPRPFEFEVARLRAALAAAKQEQPELEQALKSAEAQVAASDAAVKDAETDFQRTARLIQSNAVSRAEHENTERILQTAKSNYESAVAKRDHAQLQLDSKIGGEFTSVAQARQHLAAAELNLVESTILAPHDGFVTNLQIRPGSMVNPNTPVMSFVNTSDEGLVFGAFPQNSLNVIAEGDPVELAFATKPGQILKGTIETIIPASDLGQLLPSGQLPEIDGSKRTRFAVRIKLNEPVDLRMGASATAVVFTQTLKPLAVLQKVTIRMETFMNYVLP